MRVAALDLGTNTFLLLVAEVSDTGDLEVMADEVRVTRLGQGVHAHRQFHPEALERARICLKEYKAIIDRLGVQRVIAVATSAARDVRNGSELLKIGQDFDIPIFVIEGQKEAALTYLGATFDQAVEEDNLVLDVGGGSTELVWKDSAGAVKGTSLDIGSVRLSEMFLKSDPAAESELGEMDKYIKKQICAHTWPEPRRVIAVAGTPTTLAAIDQALPFFEDRVNGYFLSREKLESWLERLSAMSLAQRKKLVGMDPRRADVIVAGVSILLQVVRELGASGLDVSTRGVRYGVALSWSEF